MSAIAQLRAAWDRCAAIKPDALPADIVRAAVSLCEVVPAAIAEAEQLRDQLASWRETHQQLADEHGVMRVEFYALYEALSERGENKSPPVERARLYLKSDESAVRDELVRLRERVAELADTINARNAQQRNAGLMVVCMKCGNKRCPMATDAALACTNSNEPGQPGSRYA